VLSLHLLDMRSCVASLQETVRRRQECPVTAGIVTFCVKQHLIDVDESMTVSVQVKYYQEEHGRDQGGNRQ